MGGILLFPQARRIQYIATDPQFLHWRNSPALRPASDGQPRIPIPPLEELARPQQAVEDRRHYHCIPE